MGKIPGLAIGTRFWGKDPKTDFPRIEKFLQAATLLGKVHVAVNTAEDTIGTLTFITKNFPDVVAFSVTPWGRFVPPLNAIVSQSVKAGTNRLLLASAEFPPESHQVESLLGHVGDDTLVAGARFQEHEFSAGRNRGNGINVPWNTFSVWNLNYLGRNGFSLIGDAPFDPTQAGVEELSTISFYQQLKRVQGVCMGPEAKLVSVPGFYKEWNMDGWDQDRIARHAKKIASKIARPAAQLKWAGLPCPEVIHIA